MELEENIFNAVNEKKSFERYGDQPIVPDMVKPVNLYDDDLIKMAEDRRESNFSLQSDISIGTTESENSLPHIKYFRTPSVVVSDHSEDTGCVTYEDIRRMHNAYHRRRRSRPGRRHSDVLVEPNEKYDYGGRSDPAMIGSASSETIEYFKNSQNVSPVPRRKNCGYRDGQNSLSLDDVIGDFELGGNFDRKTVSECGSSNELSPILSQYGSSNCSENSSRRSSIFSEISPVFLSKNLNFNEPQKVSGFDSGTKTPADKNSTTFSSYYNSRETHAMDDADLFLLERQRSLSYDDLYLDSSVTSDRSYSDLSTDFSASSSLSNLPGTIYYHNYNPSRDYDCSYRSPEITVQTDRTTNRKSKGVDIKTSKSCSDFLSVSRIVEDYPHLRRRRHSNDQVAFDTSEYCGKPSDCEGGGRKKWTSQSKSSGRRHTDRMSARIKVALGRLITLQLKSFHESLNFQKENCLISTRKTKSSEDVYECERKKASIEVREGSPKSKRGQNNISKVIRSELEQNKVMKVADDNKKVTLKKEWLSVNWKDGDYEGDPEYRRKNSISRKISDCSTCSLYSDISGSLITVNAKTKTSGWRKLRNIVQWTPFFQTYKKQRYPWVQLAGHQGNFKAGPEQGTILKKLCPKEEKCYKILMKDVLRPYVPEYKGQVTCDDTDSVYLQLQDLLVDFVSPCVLDCKLGVRTYLEEELQKAKDKPKLRKDMYEKMIQIDPKAPTSEEHRLKAVTKPRYMVWRETISSTSTLGFRLEGIRTSDGKSSKDFKTTRTKDEVKKAFRDFINGFPHAVSKYVQRLKAIKATLEVSIFFSSHEVIGSSLLFVHDKDKANVWLIDFAKTLMLPDHTFIDHKSQWEVGNHEDGYLIGINNLIQIFTELEEEQNLEDPKTAGSATVATLSAPSVNSANQT